MKKSTLIVLVVILVPIIIMGSLAVMGAENFEKQKESGHGDEPEGDTTEETVPTSTEIVLPFSYQFAGSTAASAI